MQRGNGRLPALFTLLALLTAAAALTACGGGEDVTITQEASTSSDATKDDMSDEEIANLEQEIEDLQDQVAESDDSEDTTVSSTTESPPPEGDTGTGGVPATAESCGAGVYVESGTTSCSFGLNVAADYFSTPGNTFESFSPATGQTYKMTCTGPPPIVCTGGNNATVYITHA